MSIEVMEQPMDNNVGWACIIDTDRRRMRRLARRVGKRFTVCKGTRPRIYQFELPTKVNAEVPL